MGRLFALLMVVALVPACEHMGKGGGGSSSFGHPSYGGSSGPGGHAPSSSLSSSSPSSSSSRPTHASSSSLASRTADGAVQTAKAVGEALLEGMVLDGDETVTVAPVGPGADPNESVGDLCLDCPDPGNCDSCPAGPRGAP